jgi:predicted nucleotidyltransferase
VTTNVARNLHLDSGLVAALEAACGRLRARFPVDRIVLYGSAAWGTLDDESDVDILIVLKDHPDHDTEDQISRVIFDVNLEFDTNLSELIVDRHTWDHGLVSVMPIHEDIEQRGIRI